MTLVCASYPRSGCIVVYIISDNVDFFESSQREADGIIAGLRGALESKSTELDSLKTKYTNLRADHEHESDLFTQDCEDLLCLLESEGIDKPSITRFSRFTS